ncbi:Protein MICROTUBULE ORGANIZATION 1, partial [Sarracenia purpurea var. burkii]
TNNKAVVLKVHKEYVPLCMECLNDGTPEVRDAAFSALAAVAKLVGIRPLEKSLEKLDDVRKKKLSDMIGGSGAGPVGTTSVIIKTSIGSSSSMEASDGIFVRRSAASMLSGKKPVQAALSIFFLYFFLNPASKKGGNVKSGFNKKGDAAGQLKTFKQVEPEDVEPADMSLEEIEGRLGSLIHADTISQLKAD